MVIGTEASYLGPGLSISSTYLSIPPGRHFFYSRVRHFAPWLTQVRLANKYRKYERPQSGCSMLRLTFRSPNCAFKFSDGKSAQDAGKEGLAVGCADAAVRHAGHAGIPLLHRRRGGRGGLKRFRCLLTLCT